MSVGQDSPCCAPARAEPNNPSMAATVQTRSKNKSTKGMALIPGAEFLMGTQDGEGYPADGEGPVRRVRLDSFYIDVCTVTNAQFAQFVKSTGYKTEAETFGWSFVFHSLVPLGVAETVNKAVLEAPWWWPVAGTYWRRPEGPGSSVAKRPTHPVVHVSWNDAIAYCQWAGKRLATEAEWEYAARGGLHQMRYPWGDELMSGGQHRCNIWQGQFPDVNTGEDGYISTAPARSFPPNDFGLYNTAGNVWEWCFDWFSATNQSTDLQKSPAGPATGTAKSMRGGSYLCHSDRKSVV
jgi:formylglycine-generating enzyme required for sulfatase activity